MALFHWVLLWVKILWQLNLIWTYFWIILYLGPETPCDTDGVQTYGIAGDAPFTFTVLLTLEGASTVKGKRCVSSNPISLHTSETVSSDTRLAYSEYINMGAVPHTFLGTWLWHSLKPRASQHSLCAAEHISVTRWAERRANTGHCNRLTAVGSMRPPNRTSGKGRIISRVSVTLIWYLGTIGN